LENVTITVDGAEENLRTTTDASGFFRLEPVPAGRFFVHVDGHKAAGSQLPDGDYYPAVGKAWEAMAGRTNTLAAGTGAIYLPLIAAGTLQSVSPISNTVVTFPASVLATNPAFVGVSVIVPANNLYDDNGLRNGRVGLAPVPGDRLPEPLPTGLHHVLDISVQTDGPANFDKPVPIRFPNLPDPVTGVRLPPGAKSALMSYNHDSGLHSIEYHFVLLEARAGPSLPTGFRLHDPHPTWSDCHMIEIESPGRASARNIVEDEPTLRL
jgi:hypothetical protein